ncbi:MAG TPA: complex I subunit 1 family protein [bacterium]|nr:complex I subunit 1 family protein [bacterium]
MSWLLELLKAIGLAIVIFTFLAVVGAMFGVYLERKIAGWIQARLGPKHVGPQGLLQTIADTVKLLQKEHITPRRADVLMFNAAPVVVAVAALLDWVVIPFGTLGSRVLVVRDINIGVLYFSAMASITVLGILTGGWSSNNKYALLGGLRSASQLISYELPLALGILWAAMVAGTLSTVGIVEAQIQQGGWFLFTLPPPIGRLGAPFGILAAITFLVAATAEVNRVPFDLPEAESELVAGYFVEYTGMRFALFQLGEYGEMFGMAALATIMFLGGWAEPHLAPYLWVIVALGALVLAAVLLLTARHSLIVRPVLILAVLTAAVGLLMSAGVHLPSIVWFLMKLFTLVFFLMWVRWTYPRLRLGQLLNLSWKVLLPLGLLNLLATGLVLTLGGR